MCSLVRAPALLVSVQFLIITLSSILRKAHLSFKGKRGYQKRAHLILSLFSEPLALTEEQNILCVTLHEYCWWFCKKQEGRQFSTGFPDSQTLSLSASFYCKTRITILVLPYLSSTAKDNERKTSLRVIDPKDRQNTDVAVV